MNHGNPLPTGPLPKLAPIASLQTLFDISASHLLKQNAKAQDHNETCLYRAPRGRSCAVGCLIPDELYAAFADPDAKFGNRLEQISVTALPVEVREFLGMGAKNEMSPSEASRDKVASRLQNIHDTFQPDQWRAKLLALALEFNLNTVPVFG